MYYHTKICFFILTIGCLGAGRALAQNVGVGYYIADQFKVSVPNTSGNPVTPYIMNNGPSNAQGSIALRTAAGICLDVRPSGVVNILNGTGGQDPTLCFNPDPQLGQSIGRINSFKDLAFAANNRLLNNNQYDMFIHTDGRISLGLNGNVAIGTTNPVDAKLYVKGTIKSGLDGPIIGMGASNAAGCLIGTYTDNPFMLGANLPAGPSALIVAHNNSSIQMSFGKAYVSLSAANVAKYGLFVQKGILSEAFALAPASSWADYVFDKKYKLASLDSVEAYIRANRHLPDIPSADSIEKQGYDLHDMNRRFMEKIEELTLYVIDQQKTIERQQKEIEALHRQEQRITELSKQVERLSKRQ